MLAVALAAAAGCTETHTSVLPYPIPLTLTGPGGALIGQAVVGGTTAPFPVVVDTGTILTTFDDGSGQTRAQFGDIVLYGVDGSGNAIPRLSVQNVQLFEGPLGLVGIDAATVHVGGVFGGDNLSRFSVALDYRGPQPTMTLSPNVTPCSCELAPSCDRSTCYSVLPFTLAGGQDTALQSQTRIVIGDNQYSYPPTRVLLDACLEPYPDPLSADEPCVPPGRDLTACPFPPYLPSGVDVKLIVATGFPGLALSANAYDRLRGAGAAAELLAGGTTTLHLFDPDDEGPSGAGVQAARATLGRAKNLPSDPGASALALVSTEAYFGPCASLARSRRMRRKLAKQTRADIDAGTDEPTCAVTADESCPTGQALIAACQNGNNGGNADICDDDKDATPTPAAVELTAPIDVWVLPDVTPLLVGINADVRTTAPTVDGIIGTTVLSKLVATIDYPGNRFIARCASAADCLAYPRLSRPSLFDCGFCVGAQEITNQCNVAPVPGSFACPPGP